MPTGVLTALFQVVRLFIKGSIYFGGCIASKTFPLLQLCKHGRALPASVELTQHLGWHKAAACIGEKGELFEQEFPLR